MTRFYDSKVLPSAQHSLADSLGWWWILFWFSDFCPSLLLFFLESCFNLLWPRCYCHWRNANQIGKVQIGAFLKCLIHVFIFRTKIGGVYCSYTKTPTSEHFEAERVRLNYPFSARASAFFLIGRPRAVRQADAQQEASSKGVFAHSCLNQYICKSNAR